MLEKCKIIAILIVSLCFLLILTRNLYANITISKDKFYDYSLKMLDIRMK